MDMEDGDKRGPGEGGGGYRVHQANGSDFPMSLNVDA